MKKLIYCALALAAGFFVASCQQENLEPVAQENSVTYTVEVPGVDTKAIGDGQNVDQLVYEVWKTGEDGVITDKSTRLYQKTINLAPDAPRKWIVTLNLVQNQTYKALFWAQVGKPKGHENYNTDQLTNVYYAYDVTKDYSSNQESYAAFYGTDVLDTHTPLKGKTITLTRPFAQLNIGTLNTALEDEYAIDMLQSSVEVTVPTQFNVATSEVDNHQKINFALADVPSDPKVLPVSGTDYDYVAMNYVFAGANTSVEYTINTTITPSGATEGTPATINKTIPNVPLKENYRTNIVGNLLTSSAEYEVVIDKEFNTPDELVDAWNGTEINEPKKSAEDENVYEIEYSSELAWLAAAVNGTLPETKAAPAADSFAGKTFKLIDNVDLGNNEWTPIGNSTNPFKGIFDGNGKTIKNLKITGKNSNVGLFGMTTDGEIKNLTVENANVSGRLNVGVVAGTPYTSKYTNITVKGHVEVNGMAYVGGVGGKNAYANWANITVNVDETSYVNANSIENGTAYRSYVGGVVGFNGEGGHSFENITSNIDVKGSTIDVGGLFGIAHYGNQFVDCSCSGDVEIYAAEEADEAQEIGGIAGVWNNGGADVVMTNCEFTGTVTTNIDRETVWYSNLVGRPYSATGTGRLIIDGIEMIANGVGVKDGEYYVTSAQGLLWVEAQAQADNFFAGKTIKLANDLDMAGVTISNPIHFWNGRTTFDGQEFTISNLTMSTTSTEKKPFSLFTGTADIKNVRFDNANISGYSYVAVVAGNLYGNIDNCHVANSTVTCTYWMAGALSGQYNSGNVTNCTVTNTTVTGPAAVGALVGVINETKGDRKVENCTVSDCTIAQEGSFGEDYDKMFSAAVGLINISKSNIYFTNCSVENTTVKGTESTDLFGSNDGDETIVYVDGNEFVSNGVTKDAEGNFYISSAAGLKWVADVVNATTPYSATLFDSKTVKLMNDIDLKNEEWIPIGDDRSQRTEFHGVFDGQGHTVKNVKISKKTDREDENKSSYGLFGNLKGTVKNLTVENVSISGAPKFIGALVGRMNDGLIENCHVINSSVECENWTIGGLLGQLNNGKISGCSVESTTVKGYGAVAGIVGIALSSGERTIENCSVENTTIVQNGSFGGNYDNMFGAIVGALYSGTLTVNLNGCSVENTTIKDVVSTELCGFISEGDKLVVDGYEILAPGLGYNNTLKTYAVSSSEGLVAMSNTTIKGGESVILTADIDLTGVEFNGLNAFNPESKNTFNGQGHTVSNWTYTGGAADMAFIKNWVGTIKNVTIEGASLKTNGRSAVLAAKVYANIENCHVVESTIEDSYWACGVIAGLYNNGNIENCSVDRCYVKSNGGVGGIVGVINETAGERNIESCTVKNTTVCNTDIYGEEYSGALVAGILNVANATINFNNCTLENNTKQGEYVGDLFYSAEGNNVFVDGVQQ